MCQGTLQAHQKFTESVTISLHMWCVCQPMLNSNMLHCLQVSLTYCEPEMHLERRQGFMHFHRLLSCMCFNTCTPQQASVAPDSPHLSTCTFCTIGSRPHGSSGKTVNLLQPCHLPGGQGFSGQVSSVSTTWPSSTTAPLYLQSLPPAVALLVICTLACRAVCGPHSTGQACRSSW